MQSDAVSMDELWKDFDCEVRRAEVAVGLLLALCTHSDSVEAERKHALQEQAGTFFPYAWDMFHDYAIIMLTRLADPAKQGPGKENCSLDYVLQAMGIDLDETRHQELKPLVDRFREKVENARRHRNKRIAHLDRTYIFNPDAEYEKLGPVKYLDVKQAAESLCRIMEILHESTGQGQIGRGATDMRIGVQAGYQLWEALHDARRWQRLMFEHRDLGEKGVWDIVRKGRFPDWPRDWRLPPPSLEMVGLDD